MSTLSWNCQGLGNRPTVLALKRALRVEAPKFVFLIETKHSSDSMNALKNELGYNQGVAISSVGFSGGLALLWKPDSTVEIKGITRWYIDAIVDSDNNGDIWRLTGFYGHPETSKREETWQLLESLSHVSALPWLCIGDFNEITSATEKAGGNVRSERQMTRFRDVIHFCGFHDLGFHGVPCTWYKNQLSEVRLRIRLDRALANHAWKSKFVGAEVHHVPMSTSDHSLLALRLPKQEEDRNHKGQRMFRFEAMWLRDPQCDEVVQVAWYEGLCKPGGYPFTNCIDICRSRL